MHSYQYLSKRFMFEKLVLLLADHAGVKVFDQSYIDHDDSASVYDEYRFTSSMSYFRSFI
ncbi:hypothetical protein DERP_000265 [Dermatophagoides pteronyssinus]|uniref:Uncharacterized protein n=1 Tax=Dermatophagoides pteronyssinus TaxID=6956 RepID=A0ABQ8IZR6_DERPT|nr:hypothetical protein DERP_000265 [Dermatophagoides pteronyssinus]